MINYCIHMIDATEAKSRVLWCSGKNTSQQNLGVG